jgi:hypothetical protein
MWLEAPVVGGFTFFLRNIAVWLCWSCAIDYCSLLKTRLLINYLRIHTSLILLMIVCLIDFVLGFMIYVFGFVALTLLSDLSGGILPIPAVSFETNMIVVLLAVVTLKMRALIDTGVVIPPSTLNFSQLMLALSGLFLLQLIPFETYGSDLFYASMVPSIWLWLFTISVVVSKGLSGLSWYLQFIFKHFDIETHTFERGAQLFYPVFVILLIGCLFSVYFANVITAIGVIFHNSIFALMRMSNTR